MFNWIIGIPLLTLFASAALVLAIIPSTRRETSRPTLNALLIVISAWAFCSFMFHSITIPSTLFWMYLIIFCGLATGAVGVHFCARFTEQTAAIAKWVVAIFYVLCSLPLVPLLGGKIVTEATMLPNGAVEIVFGPIAPFLWSIISLTILIAIAILIVTLWRSSRSEKKYISYTLVGFILMCLGSLSNLFISSYPVDIAANFIFISLVTYAVVSRYALRPSLRQTWYLSLPIIGLMLTLCYVAMLTFCLKWLELTTSTSHLIAISTIMIFGVITFSPSRKFLSDKLTQYFFPDTYRYRKALSDLAHVDRSLIRWTDSVTNILNIIAKVTNADDAMLLVRNSKATYFEAKYAVGHHQASILRLRLPADSPPVKALTESSAVLSAEEIGQQTTLKALIRGRDDTLEEISLTLYCGVRDYKELLAIVGLIYKSPHDGERAGIRDFLELASHQIATLIVNVNLYQESQYEIAERKRAEEALRKSEQHYRQLFEGIRDAVIVLSPQLRFLDCNKVTLQGLGYSREEFLHTDLTDIVQPDFLAAMVNHLEKVRAGEAIIEESVYRDKNGSVIPVEVSSHGIEYNGQPAILAVVRDITERKQAEKRESQLQQELILSSRLASIGEMAAGIAHEINNPLTGVIGFSDLLVKKDLPEDIRKDVNFIRDGARRVARITSRMLSYAHQSKLEYTIVDVNDLIKSTIAMQAYVMESSNIKVNTRLNPDLPVTVADAGQLQQVFLNIILNAKVAMIEAHNRGSLLIKTEITDNTIKISFKDNGSGITEENLEKIFNPFFTTREVGKGAGLGLSVCYGIVSQHGGKIYAESTLGKGATFIVELPIVTKAEQLKLSAPTAKEPERVSKAKILIIDDDLIVQQFLTEMLSEEGHEIEIANNGDDALERLGGKDYNLILLDIKLPGTNGIEIYKHLQKTAKSLANRVIFITGDTTTGTMTFLNRNEAPYITKPFDTEQLKKIIHSILALST